MSNLDANQKALGGVIARALHTIVNEEIPRVLDPLRRELQRELRDTRSSVDRMSWRWDQRERGPQRVDLRDTVAKGVACMVRAFVRPDPYPTLGDAATLTRDTPLDLARDAYANQPDVALVLTNLPKLVRKAASVPASTTDTAWAAIFAERRNSGLLPALAPASVYSRLSARALRADLSGMQTLKFATRAASPTAGGDFVGELSPIPVRRIGLSMSELGPVKKLGVISIFSEELRERSVPTIEAVISDALQTDTALILDARLLDANPATATRPAGLLNGVTPITAAASGGLPALIGDLSALVGAIPGAADPVFIMGAADAMRAALLSPGLSQTVTIMTSTIMPAGTVIALDAADFASAENDAPRIDISEDATLHLDDTPVAIGTPGSPAIVAAPTQSLFQTDLLAIRLLHFVTWAMRRPNRVAFIEAVTW